MCAGRAGGSAQEQGRAEDGTELSEQKLCLKVHTRAAVPVPPHGRHQAQKAGHASLDHWPDLNSGYGIMF